MEPHRVNWLVRQLKDAPDTLRIEAFAVHARGPGSAELLGAVRANPTILIGDATKELRAFRIAQSSPAGSKRGTGRGAFIDSLLTAIDEFYEQVIQNLKPWMPSPPRLRSPDEPKLVEQVHTSLVSTAISSQDGPQPSETTVVASRDGHQGASYTPQAIPDQRSEATEEDMTPDTVAT